MIDGTTTYKATGMLQLDDSTDANTTSFTLGPQMNREVLEDLIDTLKEEYIVITYRINTIEVGEKINNTDELCSTS